MKSAVFLGLFCLSCALFGEYRENPDANTLWMEDGQNLAGWRDGLLMTTNPAGGFYVQPAGASVSGGRYVRQSADYPWFVTEINSIEFLGQYRDLTISGYFGMIGAPMTGLFAVRRDRSSNGETFLRLDVHGLKLGFKYMKQVRVPENYVEATVRGDDLEIQVVLAVPAEDVCVRLYSSYTMPLLSFNHEDKLQLRPVDKTNPRVWTGILKDFRQNGKVKGFFLMKATVLGGGIKVPLWGTVRNAF